MKPYEEYEKTARTGSPFSNGSGWQIWQFNVCLGQEDPARRCVNDNDDCPLILLSLDDKTPREWTFGATPRCTEKTTAVEARRTAKQERDAADKAATAADHYPMFPEVTE